MHIFGHSQNHSPAKRTFAERFGNRFFRFCQISQNKSDNLFNFAQSFFLRIAVRGKRRKFGDTGDKRFVRFRPTDAVKKLLNLR